MSRCVASYAGIFPFFSTIICLGIGAIGSVLSIFVFMLTTVGVDEVDSAIGQFYETTVGKGQLEISPLDLKAMTRGIIARPIDIAPMSIPGGSEVAILAPFLRAEAANSSLLDLFKFQELLPFAEMGKNVRDGVTAAVAGAKLPDDVSHMISDVKKRIEAGLPKDWLTLLGADPIQVIDGINSTPGLSSCYNYKDYLVISADCRSACITALNALDSLGKGLSRLPDAIAKIPDPALGKGTAFMLELGDVIARLLEEFWPALDILPLEPFVHTSNYLQNAAFWSTEYMGTCWSIGAHLIIIGQVIAVVGLWVRRKHMMNATCVESTTTEVPETRRKDRGALPASSLPVSDCSDSSSGTIEIKSKRPEGLETRDIDQPRGNIDSGTFLF
jgi:hypothetical protein